MVRKKWATKANKVFCQLISPNITKSFKAALSRKKVGIKAIIPPEINPVSPTRQAIDKFKR